MLSGIACPCKCKYSERLICRFGQLTTVNVVKVTGRRGRIFIGVSVSFKTFRREGTGGNTSMCVCSMLSCLSDSGRCGNAFSDVLFNSRTSIPVYNLSIFSSDELSAYSSFSDVGMFGRVRIRV